MQTSINDFARSTQSTSNSTKKPAPVAGQSVTFNVKAAMQDQARVRRAIKRLNKEALSSRPHTALREPALALREGYVAPGVTNQQAKRNKDFKLALATSAVAKEEEDEGVKKAVSEPMMASWVVKKPAVHVDKKSVSGSVVLWLMVPGTDDYEVLYAQTEDRLRSLKSTSKEFLCLIDVSWQSGEHPVICWQACVDMDFEVDAAVCLVLGQNVSNIDYSSQFEDGQ